jgi:Mn-dependent DtxR family transcriptional regulator
MRFIDFSHGSFLVTKRKFTRETTKQRVYRTLYIMRESGLIKHEPYDAATLTEKGKSLAVKFDKEMRKFVEDFSLVSKMAEELKQKRAQEESESRDLMTT